VGFEFGADLTMDMTEKIITMNQSTSSSQLLLGHRIIQFKCVDSPFFTTFDGSWTLQQLSPDQNGLPRTRVLYTVHVRPKGPVPVAALEWRIKEDVPTNLRAVKRAAMEAIQIDTGVDSGRKHFKTNWLKDETMAAYLKS